MGKQYLNGVLYSGVVNHIGVDEPKVYHADWICTSSSAFGTALTETLNLPAGKYIIMAYTPYTQAVEWNNGYLFMLKVNNSYPANGISVINRQYGHASIFMDLTEDSDITFCTGSSISISFDSNYFDRGGMDAIQIQPYYNLHKYSLTEQVIGTWVDGKPLYEKTFSGLSIDLPSMSWVNTNKAISNCKKCVNIICSGLTSTISAIGDIRTNENGAIYLMGMRNVMVTLTEFTIQYTKTTD